MERLVIQGGVKLRGELEVHGAKNSSLPILAATILCDDTTVLHNCPNLTDVKAANEILKYIGCAIKVEGNTVIIDPTNITKSEIPEYLMRQMRSSIVFLGAIVSKLGKAKISFPGGCELGPRPIDLHLSGLRKLGLNIKEEGGYLDCSLESKKFTGSKISLSFPSVGATENIILAAVKAEGTTIITNAAQEPEILDLANYLNSCGAKIYGAGKSTVVIEGVDSLNGTEHRIMPDRIVAATYLCCGAVTQGELLIRNLSSYDLESILPIIEEMGCKIVTGHDSIYIRGREKLKPIKCLRTMPYPGFPTDAQSPLMAMSTIAEGTSMFVENIFENRFKVAGELIRMGSDISIEGKVAVVNGVEKLYGATVEASDLRGGAALVIAGLAAEGKTIIVNIGHIDRGYENIEENLKKIEAKIIRE